MTTNITLTKEELSAQLQESVNSGETFIPMRVFFKKWSQRYFRAASVSELQGVVAVLPGPFIMSTDGLTFLTLGPEGGQQMPISVDRLPSH